MRGTTIRLFVLVALASFATWRYYGPQPAPQITSQATLPAPTMQSRPTATGGSEVAAAFKARRSDVMVGGRGEVNRVLPDDNDGSRHQRFILRLADGITLLVAHNIDLAPRIDGLAVGDTVEFKGEYEFNERGGVLHWTHDDPAGRHLDGWLKHRGRTYH